jgi:CHAT domain-containing protein/tetratricopeptide (TPR) repeat protein
MVLLDLAFVYSKTGRGPQADALFRRASSLLKEARGPLHTDYATSLKGIGDAYFLQKNYFYAALFYTQAMDICRQRLGVMHPDYATRLNDMVFFQINRGAFEMAEPLLRQVLKIRKQVLGEDHPDYVQSLANLAIVYQFKGDYAKAKPLFQTALKKAEGWVDLAASLQSERQQLAMSQTYRYALDHYIMAAFAAHEDPRVVYNHVLVWKGAVFARQERQRVLRRRPDLAADFAKIESIANQVAQLTFATPRAEEMEKWRQRLQELNDERERLEGVLAGHSAEFAKLRGPNRFEADQILKALPADTAVVDFLEHTVLELTPSSLERSKWERRLTAFVLCQDQPIEEIDLGPTEALAKAIDQWRAGMGRAWRTSKDDPAIKIRQLVWQPLLSKLGGIKTLLVSPDGVLNRFPLAALPGEKDGSYLIEELAIAVIPVPGLLPELLRNPPTGRPDPSLVVVGNVDYGTSRGTDAYPPLPGTANEMGLAQKAFRSRFPSGKVTPLADAGATRQAVASALSTHSWAHLAIHGYFAEGKKQAGAQDIQQAGLSAGRDGTRQTPRGTDPNLFCGLVLAGANCPSVADPRRGLLLAAEIATLDLHNLETAVLSACNSGRGKEAGGEGVLGLQRAFQVAGARTVVSSLWSIPDAETSELMAAFYENLWHKGMSKLEALRQAQLTMLTKGRTKTGAKRGPLEPEDASTAESKPASAPFYWAAFVLSGDWR